jgi:hypothetical protein
MTLTLVMGVLNQHELATQSLELAMHTLGEPKDTQILLIDNGSSTPYLDHIKAAVKTYAERVGELKVIRNPENVGNYPLFFQAREQADGEAIAVIHSDLFIYGQNWDTHIKQWFEGEPQLGLIGFLGSSEIDNFGGRGMGTMSNFQGTTLGRWSGSKAEIHGARIEDNGRRWGAVVDGCAMIFRKEAFAQIPQRPEFPPHHFYDRLFSAQMKELGWRTGVLGVAIDHISGQTANQEQAWVDTAKAWAEKHLGLTEPQQWKDYDPVWFGNTMNPSRGHVPQGFDHVIYLAAERMFLREYRDSKHIIPFHA